MGEPEYFPEVSNWYRENPEYESDTTDIWFNDALGLKMRVRSVTGPFRTHTSEYVAEVRDCPSDDPEWNQIGNNVDTQSSVQLLAYEYAKEHNEREE